MRDFEEGERERERKSKQGRLNLSMEIECKLIYRLFDNDHSLLPAISSLDEVKGGEGRRPRMLMRVSKPRAREGRL